MAHQTVITISPRAAAHLAERRHALTIAEAQLRAAINVLLLEHGVTGDVQLVDVRATEDEGALVILVPDPGADPGADPTAAGGGG